MLIALEKSLTMLRVDNNIQRSDSKKCEWEIFLFFPLLAEENEKRRKQENRK